LRILWFFKYSDSAIFLAGTGGGVGNLGGGVGSRGGVGGRSTGTDSITSVGLVIGAICSCAITRDSSLVISDDRGSTSIRSSSDTGDETIRFFDLRMAGFGIDEGADVALSLTLSLSPLSALTLANFFTSIDMSASTTGESTLRRRANALGLSPTTAWCSSSESEK
jgi:hypothetical protein